VCGGGDLCDASGTCYAPDTDGDGTGLSSAYPGDREIDSHPSVIFYEDFEDATVEEMEAGWDYVEHPDMMSFNGDVPAGAIAGSQALQMLVPGGSGVTGVALYESLPTQQDTVYVRYYVQYDNRSDLYHHAGMWLGGYNPPTQWPQGTAGRTPDGTDFFHNALEPMGDSLDLDQYGQWPDMGCWQPDPQCYGNNLMVGARPTVLADTWNCFELMLKPNTPGRNNGEFAVWINDQLIQHLREGAPNMERVGPDSWGPNPNADPFPGFNWRNTIDLGVNWIWPTLYADAGPSSMSWDQVVVALQRIGCITPAR
jgi:hypothetical protein